MDNRHKVALQGVIADVRAWIAENRWIVPATLVLGGVVIGQWGIGWLIAGGAILGAGYLMAREAERP